MSNVFLSGLDSGYHLTSTTITFAFSDAYFAWNTYEEAQFRAALEQWSNVANVTFVETANQAQADFRLFNVDDSIIGSGVLADFEYPYGGQQFGRFNYEGLGWDYDNTTGGLEQGGYGYSTILHEVGHGLGLAHPHDASGSSTIFPGVSSPWDTGNYGYNQGLYTVMGYNDGRVVDGLSPYTIENYGWSGGPMAFDIFAIQRIYGANTSYNTGDDTYSLPEVNDTGTFYQAIWDAGGFDTIAYGGSAATNIDLRTATLRYGDPHAGGYLSTAAGIYGGFTIAAGVRIEAASGGSGNDRIIGNNARNVIDGNDGDDLIKGLNGHDLLRGGAGADVIIGGYGSDTIEGGDNDDRLYGQIGNDWIETGDGANLADGGDGNDRVIGGIDADKIYGGAGRDALLGGDGNDMIWGGDDNDVLVGGSGNDRLIGQRGVNRMYGEDGDDVLVGGNERDRLIGGNDNDRLVGRGGDDVLIGGDGNDTLIGGPGRDFYYGGAGDDSYVFSNGDRDMAVIQDGWGDDRIVRFADGEDILNLRQVSGLTSFNQLTITADGNDTLVTFGADSIRLVNVDPSLITDDDILI